MARVAVPQYLLYPEQDFSKAAPGHKFYLYPAVWQQDWSAISGGKVKALQKICGLSADGDDKARAQALVDRQRSLVDSLQAQPERGIWQLPAKSTAPFATGLGMEHPLENGFAFLTPYGLPYLPGSGIKGVVRAAAFELAKRKFADLDPAGWDDPAIDALFGRVEDSKKDSGGRQGALRFWDAYPQPPLRGELLQVEIMTPHQSHYYAGEQPPHDSGSPNPIPFLAIAPGVGFNFIVECNLPLLRRCAPELAQDGRWQGLLRAAFEHAFAWLGFGAKTAVGYGAMEADQDELDRLGSVAEQRAKQIKRERELAEIDDPLLRRLEQLLDERPDKGQPEHVFLIQLLEKGSFQGEEARVAEEIKKRMLATKHWNPEGKGSKPAQKKAHGHTLKVLEYLEK